MKGLYERHTELDDVMDRARQLSVRTMIVDVEPLVSWWDNTQESLDWGVAMVVGKVATLPEVRVLVFSKISAISDERRTLLILYGARSASVFHGNNNCGIRIG